MTLKDLCNRYNYLSEIYVVYKLRGSEEDAKDIEARMREVYRLAKTFFTDVPRREAVVKRGVATFILHYPA